MNLKKALEKAKGLRGEDASRPQVHPVRVARKVQGSDWKPPVYAESNRVELDTATLIDHHCVCISPDAPELEYYKVLRTKIQHLTSKQGWKTVMITSPREAEGKTLTAVNLALTFAKAYNQTVMLVDCDLRKQGIHRVLGYECEFGVVDYLMGEQDLKEFITWPGGRPDDHHLRRPQRFEQRRTPRIGSHEGPGAGAEITLRGSLHPVRHPPYPERCRRHRVGLACGLHRDGGGGRPDRPARCQKGPGHAAAGEVSRLRPQP